MRLIFLLLAFFSSILFINRSFAFTLNNTVAAAFAQDRVVVNVASHTCNNLGVTNQELLSLIEEAVNAYWNRVPNSRLQLAAGQLISVSDKFRTDAICTSGGTGNCTPNPDLIVSNDVIVSCNVDNSSQNFSNGVLALTVSNNISGRSIIGALILLNDKASNSFQNLAHDKKVSVLAHEIGHAVGLGHSPVTDSLMYYTLVPMRTSLGEDDFDGIAYLYPTEQPLGGCGTIEDTHSQNPGNGLLIFIVAILLAQLAWQLASYKNNRPRR